MSLLLFVISSFSGLRRTHFLIRDVISKVRYPFSEAQIVASERQMTEKEKEKRDWAGQTRELSRVHSPSGKATNLVLFFPLIAISPSLSAI